MSIGHVLWHLCGDLRFLFIRRWAKLIVRLGGNTRYGSQRNCPDCGSMIRWGNFWDGR